MINRGDSFKRKKRPAVQRDNVEININRSDGEGKKHSLKQFARILNEYVSDVNENEKVEKHPNKIYRVAFLGSEEVGKTSIIDQFMSSEHADVYEDIQEKIVVGNDEVAGR